MSQSARSSHSSEISFELQRTSKTDIADAVSTSPVD
jgi:hypothetical protein